MIVNINEFYNNKNWKQYVPLEAFQEEMRLVGETFLKDVKVKNVLSITYSIDDYGENPIYIEYLDDNGQKHLVKLKPAIHEELDSVLSKYATIDYVNQKFAEAVQTSKDYTDQAKEALTVLINGSKEDAIQVSKAYTDVEINKLNTNLKEYVDEQDHILWQEITTYANTAVNESFIQAKQYTDTEINKVKNEITTESDSVLQQAKDYADQKDNVTLVSSKNYTDTKHEEALTAIEEGNAETLEASKSYTNTQLENYATKTEAENQNKIYGWNLNTQTWDKCDGNFTVTHNGSDITKIGYRQNVDDNEKIIDFTNFAKNDEVTPLSSKLQNIWDGHKAAFIYWVPNIDINTMKLENAENDVKVTLNDGDVVYWRKNAYQPSGAELKVGFGTELPKTENSIVIRADSSDKTISAMHFTAEGDTAYFRPDSYIKKSQAPLWSWAGDESEKKPTNVTLSDFYDGYISFTIETHNSIDPDLREVVGYMSRSRPVSVANVEALVQEQNATNTKNVSVSLQQKARTVREVTNNSTLVETKDFYILNLDFSFVPNVLPTSIENSFIENILIDAPEFNGKSFNITFKANEHTATSKGVVGDLLNIKTCAVPIDETIKNVEVVVKDKIIIRKETE